MKLSVVIPTFNRSASLLKTLECLRDQVVPRGLAWEVLVVDNNCVDDTADVVRAAAKTFPVRLRHILEIHQGASNARNRGIEEADGEFVLFTDDDVRPDPHWIAAIISTFERYSCDCVAGRIELEWKCTRPGWLTDELLGFLARLDYGPEEHALQSEAEPPFGPNMAFRRSIFGRIGGFDASMGPKAGSLARGEEPELFSRFVRAGLSAVYQPKAIVYHCVHSRQVRKSFFRSVHFLSGRDRGLRFGPARGKSVWGVPMFLFPQLLRSILNFATTAVVEGFTRSLRKEMNVWYFLGFILGCTEGYRAKKRRIA